MQGKLDWERTIASRIERRAPLVSASSPVANMRGCGKGIPRVSCTHNVLVQSLLFLAARFRVRFGEHLAAMTLVNR